MSDLLQEMRKEFGNEMAGDGGRPELVPFSDNIGVVKKGYAKQFEKSGDIQLQWNLSVTESTPANVGGFVSLKYPAKPKGIKWEEGNRLPVILTDPAEIHLDKKCWFHGLTRICSVLGLALPSDEILSNEFLATGWASAAEGKQVVFRTGKPDSNGYTSIPVYVISGKQVVGMSAPNEEKKPGLTRLDLARHEIQKAIAKG